MSLSFYSFSIAGCKDESPKFSFNTLPKPARVSFETKHKYCITSLITDVYNVDFKSAQSWQLHVCYLDFQTAEQDAVIFEGDNVTCIFRIGKDIEEYFRKGIFLNF